MKRREKKILLKSAPVAFHTNRINVVCVCVCGNDFTNEFSSSHSLVSLSRLFEAAAQEQGETEDIKEIKTTRDAKQKKNLNLFAARRF